MACKCNVGLGNTGVACTPIADVAKKLIFTEYYKSDGSINNVDLSSVTFNSAFFSGKVNNADAKLRWYPLPDMKNVVTERAAPIQESFNDGTVAFISQGSKNFTGIIISGPPQLLKQLESFRCVDLGVFVVDKEGNLIGSGVEDGKLAPFKVDKDSFSARLIPATDTTIQKIEVTFNFASDEKDEDIIMVTSEEMTYGPLALQGLKNISATYASISTTGFIATLKTEYGTYANPVLDKGLLLADFALYNVTDSASVAITSVTESASGGVYTFVFPAQGSGEVLRLTPTKTGRDYAAVVAATITIP